MPTESTREAWLIAMVDLLRPHFSRHKAALPKELRITCGWTGKGMRTNRIGECWHGSTAADGAPHIYVSPVVAVSVEVAAVIVHELVHVVAGPGVKHGKEFARIATRLGLKGPMRSTTATPELEGMLFELIDVIGPYPHAKVTTTSAAPKQPTRMIKLVCPECGYLVRTTAMWIEVGLPLCPVHRIEMGGDLPAP